MQPIHELLARIRHDREFGKARFEIGHFDRRESTITRVAFHEIVFPEDRRRVFEVLGEAGERRQIPFHRVREVYRNGQLIWERPNAPGNPSEDKSTR
jgi:uncharacterized protein (UPF0248 family)